MNGSLRQFLGPLALVDVVADSAYSYDIKFYTNQPGLYVTNSSGIFTPSGSAFKTITVSNPDLTSTSQLQFVENAYGSVTTNLYVWNPGANDWTLYSGNGLRSESRSQYWQGIFCTETNELWDSQGHIVFRQAEKFQVLTNGCTNLIERVSDPTGTHPATNSWLYTDTGLLVFEQGPYGNWTRYQYDANGNPTATVFCVGDAPTNAPNNQCRVESVQYGEAVLTNVVVSVNPTNSSMLIFTTNVVIQKYSLNCTTLLGQEVARQYNFTCLANQNSQTNYTYACQNMGANLSDPSNLLTCTVMPLGGLFAYQPSVVYHPNGTVSCYTYTNSLDGLLNTTILESGAANNLGVVIDGNRIITVTDQAGHTLTNQVYDIASGLLISQDVIAQMDYMGRPTIVTHLNGTNYTSYGCCGPDSQTEPSGLVTTYAYDALKRKTSETRGTILTSYTLDAQGHTLATYRQGVPVSSATYDTGGRQTSSTDALSNTTFYSESYDAAGHRVRTTTYPNATTQIETYYQDGNLLSRTGTAVHGVRYEYGVAVTNGVSCQFTRTIKLRDDGSDSGESSTSFTDMLGHPYMTVRGDGVITSQSTYNSVGQLIAQKDADSNTTLYAYNDLGAAFMTALDMDRDSVIDHQDRVTYNISSVVADHGTTVQRQQSFQYDEATNSILVSQSDTSVDGLRSWQVAFGLTSTSATVYDAPNAKTTVTSTSPDGSQTISVSVQGLQQSTTRKDANGVNLSSVNYTCDTMGRVATQDDGRTVTSNSYNNANQLIAVNVGGQITQNSYDVMGRQIQTIQPDFTTNYVAYFLTGEQATNWGSRTYPSTYTYDYAGRMQTLTTWTNFANQSGAATNTWNYDPHTGQLLSKRYSDTNGPSYSYTPGGKLSTRTWARGIVTTYNYDNAGALATVTYSDGLTPNVAYTYDRRGRTLAVTDGVGTHNFTYNNAGQLLTESFPCSSAIVTNTYDTLLRRSALQVVGSTFSLQPSTFSYDAASRLSAIAQGSLQAQYAYVTNSTLVSSIVFGNNATNQMTTVKTYDNLNRLTAISQQPAPSLPPTAYAYAYNAANQRTQRTDADNSTWQYQYDFLGQVTNATRAWADSTPVAGQQYAYAFDDIGNRRTQTANGRTQSYAANLLNQYTQRSIPGFFWELGSATNAATVTINGQSTLRHNAYFAAEIPMDNSSNAAYAAFVTRGVLQNAGTNHADLISARTGHVFLAQSPEQFQYDLDGNTLSDGRFTYSWDAENRLIAMQTATNKVGLAVPAVRLFFTYDYQSRRVGKVVSNCVSGVWSLSSARTFTYDGWNLLCETICNPSSVTTNSYTWGLDLSGSAQGAGGIGGLLWETQATTNCFVAYDGNGNVTALVDANTGALDAQYDYSPFGETIRASGPLAKANPFRFSTKYTDDETGLLYYGFRFYAPQLGRWVNRDPIQEQGGRNLYGFISNESINHLDKLGFCCYSVGLCSRTVGPITVPTTTVIAGHTFNIDPWLVSLVYAIIPNHNDVKVESQVGPVTESYIRGFFADSFSDAITHYMVSTIPYPLNFGVDGYVPGHVADDAYPVTCTMQCVSKARYDVVKARIFSTATSYHLLAYNCQTWAANQLAP